MRIVPAAALVCGFLLSAPLVLAESAPVTDAAVAAARTLGKEGYDAYQAGDYQTAQDKLGRAFEVVKVPTVGLWLARSLVKLGRLVEASERYGEVTRIEQIEGKVSAQKDAQDQAAKERAELQPRIPTLRVRVEGASSSEVQIQVDGNALPAALLDMATPVDPGTRKVEGRRGEQTVTREVTLAEGQAETVLLQFDAAPAVVVPVEPPQPAAPAPPPVEPPKAAPIVAAPPPPPPTPAVARPPDTPAPEEGNPGATQRTFGWILTGVGIAGFAAWTVSGVGAYGLKRAMESECQGDVCDADLKQGVDAYNTLLRVSTTAFWIGVGGVVTGTTLLVTAPRRAEKPQAATGVTPWVGLGSVGVSGRF